MAEAGVDWFADSDATRHMSKNLKQITNLKEQTSKTWNIKGFSGKQLPMKGVGHLFFEV
jgi:hypothetical protein